MPESASKGPSAVSVHAYTPSALVRLPSWGGRTAPWLSGDIDVPECYASFEEFRPEEPADFWHYWYDEVTYVISGECEATICYPPNFNDEDRVRLRAGDLFLIKRGWSARFDVIGEDAFVHIIVQMPRAPHVEAESPTGASFTSAPRSDAGHPPRP